MDCFTYINIQPDIKTNFCGSTSGCCDMSYGQKVVCGVRQYIIRVLKSCKMGLPQIQHVYVPGLDAGLSWDLDLPRQCLSGFLKAF